MVKTVSETDFKGRYVLLEQGLRLRIAYRGSLRLVPNSTTRLLEHRFVWVALRVTACTPHTPKA